MDHKIKPTATRIGVVNTWSTLSYYNYILEDKFITSIIKKILLKFKLLTSNITIKKLSEYYIITFFYYPLTKVHSNKIKYRIFSIIKGILEQFLNKKIYFQIIELPSMINNAEITACWIELELLNSPKLHKSIFKRVLKEYKKWSAY
jgi:hypothetical protein